MRYVILRHSRCNEDLHWDLMLEDGQVLKTFRLEVGPADFSKEPIKAVAIRDHLLKFLDYQGPVNNGLGEVAAADKGQYQMLKHTRETMEIAFDGQVLRNEFVFFFN